MTCGYRVACLVVPAHRVGARRLPSLFARSYSLLRHASQGMLPAPRMVARAGAPVQTPPWQHRKAVALVVEVRAGPVAARVPGAEEAVEVGAGGAVGTVAPP
jgi:hypothetical protein